MKFEESYMYASMIADNPQNSTKSDIKEALKIFESLDTEFFRDTYEDVSEYIALLKKELAARRK